VLSLPTAITFSCRQAACALASNGHLLWPGAEPTVGGENDGAETLEGPAKTQFQRSLRDFRESTSRPICLTKHALWNGPATDDGGLGCWVTTPLSGATRAS
jgi:hypothetical protein